LKSKKQLTKWSVSILEDLKYDLEIASSVIFSIADKHEDAIDAARHDVLFYLLYPELDPVIKKTPYVQRVAEIRKVNAQGEAKKALSLVTDDMVEDLAIVGSAKECKDKIKKLYDYGITLPVVRVSIKPFKENERKAVFLRAIEALKIKHTSQ
jgi:alkanesulfonate monooxygenase SsuD/methylene tetrahydromethanopterin reductase-like flavin-dependent oxidoreductase (luciferase family)